MSMSMSMSMSVGLSAAVLFLPQLKKAITGCSDSLERVMSISLIMFGLDVSLTEEEGETENNRR